MKPGVQFLKRTVIGGILFLLPLGIMIFAFTELWEITSNLTDEFREEFFPESDSTLFPVLLTFGALLLAAFAGGLVATTALGDAIYARMEGIAGTSIPGYLVIRQSIDDMVGGAKQLSDATGLHVVLVDLGSNSRFGFLVDQLQNGDQVVFLPGAPSAMSGIVVCVGPDKVTRTNLKSPQFMDTMKQLGHGLGKASLSENTPADPGHDGSAEKV